MSANQKKIVNENLIEIDTHNEFWPMVMCSIRYAMGRRTYMPGLVQDIVKKYRNRLSARALVQISEEVTREIESYESDGKTLGADFDHRDWKKFAEELLK